MQSDTIQQGESGLLSQISSKEEKADLLTDIIMSSLIKEFEEGK